MRLLLDTCTLLWLATDVEKIAAAAREALESADNEIYVSHLSAWEIALKSRRKNVLRLDRPAVTFVRDAIAAHGLQELPLQISSFAYLERLPPHHADPFDRALISQSIAEDCLLVTPDEKIHRYPVRVLW